MSILNFFKKEKRYQTIAVIDIGSSSIGGSIVHFDGKGEPRFCPTIQKTVREEIVYQDSIDFKRFISSTTQAIEKVITELLRSTNFVPEAYYCFLSSPFYVAQTRIIEKKFDMPTKITKDLINDLVAAEIEKFKTAHAHLYAELPQDTATLLESKVMSTTLNGYETHKPEGQVTESLRLAQFTSIASTEVLKGLRETVMRASHAHDIYFHSGLFATFSTLRDVFTTNHTFLIIDVTGELTDVGVVNDGILTENISFPFGKNTLVRKLAEKQGSIFPEAASALALYLSGAHGENKKDDLSKVIDQLGEEWLEAFKKTLKVIRSSALIPETMMVLGDNEVSRLFVQWIEKESFNDFTLSTHRFTINFLETETLKGFCTHLDTSKYDTTLMAETLFCDKLISNHA